MEWAEQHRFGRVEEGRGGRSGGGGLTKVLLKFLARESDDKPELGPCPSTSSTTAADSNLAATYLRLMG